jgi:hypothetical protein
MAIDQRKRRKKIKMVEERERTGEQRRRSGSVATGLMKNINFTLP